MQRSSKRTNNLISSNLNISILTGQFQKISINPFTLSQKKNHFFLTQLTSRTVGVNSNFPARFLMSGFIYMQSLVYHFFIANILFFQKN